MEIFYSEIRAVHIGAVMASGLLFLLRALGHNLFGARWPSALPLRILSWTIDTTLLTAALILTTIVRQFPFVDSWLTAKVLLLVVYVILGWLALRASGRRDRLISMVAAIATFLFIISVARAHDPRGIFATI